MLDEKVAEANNIHNFKSKYDRVPGISKVFNILEAVPGARIQAS